MREVCGKGRCQKCVRRDTGSPFGLNGAAAFDAALDHGDGGELRKARGARIGALCRIPIDLMGNAVIAKLEAAVVIADGLGLLDFGGRRRCEIAFDLGVEGRPGELGEKIMRRLDLRGSHRPMRRPCV
jgi:hypothetical protein